MKVRKFKKDWERREGKDIREIKIIREFYGNQGR